MSSLTGYDPEKHSESQFALVPEGLYKAVVTNSELKKTKNGLGSYIAVTLQILEGPNKGQKLFDNITWENNNPTAVSIGRGKFKSLHLACGVAMPKDTIEIHNLPLVVRVVHEERKDNKEIKAVPKNYYNKNGNTQSGNVPNAERTQVADPFAE